MTGPCLSHDFPRVLHPSPGFAQVRELEVELAAQEAAFWEAEKQAIAAEDEEEHMDAIEWRTKQAKAARARDAAAEALAQACKMPRLGQQGT